MPTKVGGVQVANELVFSLTKNLQRSKSALKLLIALMLGLKRQALKRLYMEG